MSHFLQHLASSVTRPSAEPRIRPLLGSIYAPAGVPIQTGPQSPLELDAMETISQTTKSAITAPMGETHESSRSSRLKSNARQAPAELPQSSPLLPVRGRPADLEQTRIETLFPPAGNAAEPAHPVTADSWAHGDPALGNEESKPRQEFEQRSQAEQRRIFSGDSSDSAAMVGSSTLAQRQSNLRQPPQQFAAGARNTTRREDQSSREPDEIHIHIGRVEVAAVSQPAARPAPAAPARKAMKLDEYLRRANERAE